MVRAHHGILAGPSLSNILRSPQFIAFRTGTTLRRFLCSSNFRRTAKRPPGCIACGDCDCLIDCHIKSCTHASSCKNGKTFAIPVPISCKSDHAVYLVTCKHCQKQGVGETEAPQKRLLSYLEAVDCFLQRPPCAIHRHFYDEPHTVEDIEFALLDSILPRQMPLSVVKAVRKRCENFWISKIDPAPNAKRHFHSSSPGHFNVKRG